MTRSTWNPSRELHIAAARITGACQTLRHAYLSHTAANPRPTLQPEIRTSGRGPSDPTGRQVTEHLADVARSIVDVAGCVQAAGRIRDRIGLTARPAWRIVDTLVDTDVDPWEPADLTALGQRHAVQAGCALLDHTGPAAVRWWAGSGQTDTDWLAVATLTPLSRDLERAAARARPHLHGPRDLAPTLRWCQCDDPDCDRLTRPGQGATHPTCRKRRERQHAS